MDQIEDMKAMWTELNNRVASLEETNRRMAREITAGKFKSAQEKLVTKYRMFIIVACVMIIYIGLLVINMPNGVDKYRLPLLIVWSAFFLFEASIDTYLMIKVKEIDVHESSVAEIARRAARNWKIHKIAIAIGLPLAFAAIIMFGLFMDADIYLIYGMIVGGMVGLVIGIRQLLSFLKYYRLLQS